MDNFEKQNNNSKNITRKDFNNLENSNTRHLSSKLFELKDDYSLERDAEFAADFYLDRQDEGKIFMGMNRAELIKYNLELYKQERDLDVLSNTFISVFERIGYELPKERSVEILDVACNDCPEKLILQDFFSGENYINNKTSEFPAHFFGIDIDEEVILEERKKLNEMREHDSKLNDKILNIKLVSGDAQYLEKCRELPKEVDIVFIRHPQFVEKESYNGREVWQNIFKSSLKKLNQNGLLVVTFYGLTNNFSSTLEFYDKEIFEEVIKNISGFEVLISEENSHSLKEFSDIGLIKDAFVVVLRKN